MEKFSFDPFNTFLSWRVVFIKALYYFLEINMKDISFISSKFLQ